MPDDDHEENEGDVSDSGNNTDEEIFAESFKSLLQGMHKDKKSTGRYERAKSIFNNHVKINRFTDFNLNSFNANF